MIFFENLSRLGELFAFSYSDICIEINKNMVEAGYRDPKLNSDKFFYACKKTKKEYPDKGIFEATMKALDLDQENERCSQITTKLLNWETLWAIAGYPFHIIEEIPEETKVAPSSEKLGSNLWKNIAFFESLYEETGNKLDLTDLGISKGFFSVTKTREKLFPFTVLRNIGNLLDIHPYSRLLVSELTNEEKTKLYDKYLPNELSASIKRNIFISEGMLLRESDELSKMVKNPIGQIEEMYSVLSDEEKQIILDKMIKHYQSMKKNQLSFIGNEIIPSTQK